ncbi:hypothetical protein C8R43DRAFT_1161708 [Mycena crocata]|nr:hypothetical protein C8R43DRAFT_1161708 [Mycena crocata]
MEITPRVAGNPAPVFPEDIEQAIILVLLHDVREMCGIVSLVASRFYAWTKPVTFHTIVIRPRKDWAKRISELLLPNASLIRALAIDLPSTRDRLSEEELSHIQRLLDSSGGVRHLAVVWNIWIRFPRECGSLELESLYLIWDGAHPVRLPSLDCLKHPSKLKDLTFYAPPDLHDPTPFCSWGEFFLPETDHCANLAYVAYAADRPVPMVGYLCEKIPGVKGVMFVLVDMPEKYSSAAEENGTVRDDLALCAIFSTAYVRFSGQLVGEWLGKIEGRQSMLDHPPPHAVISPADYEDQLFSTI